MNGRLPRHVQVKIVTRVWPCLFSGSKRRTKQVAPHPPCLNLLRFNGEWRLRFLACRRITRRSTTRCTSVRRAPSTRSCPQPSCRCASYPSRRITSASRRRNENGVAPLLLRRSQHRCPSHRRERGEAASATRRRGNSVKPVPPVNVRAQAVRHHPNRQPAAVAVPRLLPQATVRRHQRHQRSQRLRYH